MMDRFDNAIRCDRCGKRLDGGKVESLQNDDIICIKCKDKESFWDNYNLESIAYLNEVRLAKGIR